MKQHKLKIYTAFIVSTILLTISCKKSFLERLPEGVYDESSLLNKKGIEGLLINAYASLDGNFNAGIAGLVGLSVGAGNWIYGSMAGGEAYKGGLTFGDQTEVNAIMQWDTPNSNPDIDGKWNSLFDGIGRANQVLKSLAKVSDPNVTDADKIEIQAEAKFIRGFQHFEGKKVFGNIPFVDENVEDFKISNTDASGNYLNIWPQIEEDLKFAYDNLPETQIAIGRVNKWAAAAFLAKSYLYQKKYTEAKALFDLIIANGKNSQGVMYDLNANFGDNFRIATQNGKESIFQVQMTIDASGDNGNHDAVLTYPNGVGAGSWFFRPSQNVVNSFRTDANGLPMPATYNDIDVTSFETVPDSDPFTPYQGNLDPRLDHTVGRRGIPYLDWGMMNGVSFTASPGESITNGGPYCGKKQVFSKAENSSGLASKVNWGYFSNTQNIIVMRFADVLLMAAECEIEVGSLDKAKEYINRVRERAKNSAVLNINNNGPAANYSVGLYNSFASQDAARTAVRFERRLELAEEGHRFFDLVRWGIADQFINSEYLPKESVRRPLLFPTGVHFDVNKDEYQPITIYAITQSTKDGTSTLKQNPGY